MDRLALYLKEAEIHLQRIKYAIKDLHFPLDNLEDEEIKNRLDVVVFRFSKLQDLLGSKIFRSYLESVNFVTANKPFLELLKELEKEGIIDMDRWAELREVRNMIAHDYPYDEQEKIEAINFIVQNIEELEKIVKRLKKYASYPKRA